MELRKRVVKQLHAWIKTCTLRCVRKKATPKNFDQFDRFSLAVIGKLLE